ncbi:TetR/AcrR family transcriptional regulator [Cellulomonas sp. HZM]|uniref:TetR/AcrR family transcriptional regulator n=1 Tax=Cellulomonas sp. HZM TaxID=1454010 RepID=UPI000493A650|nr:TetR/AcrR family transcriptional regulator [Cellulomonas sp. HZM]
MPKVTDEYRAARRDEIADAALRAFRRTGFQATSMADIISESGLSAGAIYGHFASKNALVMAVAERIVGSRVADVERLAALDPMPPPPRVPRMLVEGMVRDLGSTGVMLQLWGEGVTDPELRTLAASVLAELRRTLGRYVALWHERAHGATASGAHEIGVAQAPLLVSAVQGYVIQATLVEDFDGDAYLDALERYFPA